MGQMIGRMGAWRNFDKGLKAVLILCFWTTVASAQIDTEFWFVAPEVTSDHGDAPVFLRLATFDQGAEVLLDMPANDIFEEQSWSIPPNSALSVNMTAFLNLIESKPADEVGNKGIHLTSSAEISAYYEVNNPSNPDIFALKGENALGTSFHLPFQTFAHNSGTYNVTSGFDIVASVDSTWVTILPSKNLVGHPAGEEFSVFLPFAGSTYAARATIRFSGGHPVGTKVTASSPVAITVHDDSVEGITFGGTCLDLMGDQVIPDHILGTEYIPVRGYLAGPDRIQIVATQDNTVVWVNGSETATLDEGESTQYVLNTTVGTNAAFIETSHPAAVWQSTGFGCELGGAQLPSVKCTGSNAAVFVRSTNEPMRLNLLAPAGSEGDFLLNGTSGIIQASDFAPVPSNGNWMAAQITTLESNIPVGEVTRIEHPSSVFHMGIINGGENTGTRFGYFSDFSPLEYSVGAQLSNSCLGDLLTLEVDSVDNGLYQWTGPNNFTASGLSVDLGEAVPELEGQYVVQGYTGECPVANDTIEVQVHAPAEALLDLVLIEACEGDDVALAASESEVTWYGPEGFLQQGADLSLAAVSSSMSGDYWVEWQSDFCPSVVDSVAVVVQPTPPPLSLTGGGDVCEGDALVLTSSADVSWVGPDGMLFNGNEWSLGATSSQLEGWYVATMENSICPWQLDSVLITVHAPPSPPVIEGGTVETCEGETVVLAATPEGVTWSGPIGWSSPQAEAIVGPLLPDQSGWYVAALASAHCPAALDSVWVNVIPASELQSSWELDTLVCPGNGTMVVAESSGAGGMTTTWWMENLTTGALDSLAIGDFIVLDAPGAYLAVSTTGGVCPTTHTGDIRVEWKDCDLLIPNIVTLDNNGMNDRFRIDNLVQFPNSSIQIYNRWGKEVHRDGQFGLSEGWAPSDDLEEGTYFFKLWVDRSEEIISVISQHGVSVYEEPGPLQLQGCFVVVR